MQIVLLMCFSLAMLPVAWPAPFGYKGQIAWWVSIGFGMVLPLVLTAYVRWHSLRTVRGLGLDRESALRMYLKARRRHQWAMIISFWFLLQAGGWGWAVQGLCVMTQTETGQVVTYPLTEWLILAPLLASLLLGWFASYPAEKAIWETSLGRQPGPFWSPLGFIWHVFRQGIALLLLPVAIMSVRNGVVRLYPEVEGTLGFGLVQLIFVAGFIWLSPLMIRGLFKTEPLPAGPLRERLQECAKRLKFRASEMLLWQTKSSVANALICGPLPWPRYVLFSDRLIEYLTPAEVEAVLGHEIGHAYHQHMWFYLGFLSVSILVIASSLILLLRWFVPSNSELEALLLDGAAFWATLPLVLMLAYIIFCFGLLSRLCERQADIFGCRATSPTGELTASGISTFISALGKVADLNGMNRERPGWLTTWQHGTIAQRIRYLESLLTQPAREPLFQRRFWWLKVSLLSGLALALLAIWSIDSEVIWLALR